MNRSIQVMLMCAATASAPSVLAQRDTISIVGSSTVYPFAMVVAERFGRGSDFRTPKIESTGTGGGMKLFCAGVGVGHPDITNASRAIKQSEYDNCQANGVRDIVEVKIGYDGIVMANSLEAPILRISTRDIFLGLAKDVPNPDGSQTLVANPHRNWKDVNPSLPPTAIEVLGPPPTTGTRDAFVELAMEGGCKSFEWIKAMKITDKQRYKAICHGVREDGAFVETGENDKLIVQKLAANPIALGVFGCSFLEQNADMVHGAEINDVAPGFEAITDGSYPVSRPLFFYVKKAHVGVIPGIQEFLAEFVGENSMGEKGYLSDRGLIPLPADEYEAVSDKVDNMTPISM